MGRPPVVRRLDVRINGRLAGEYRYNPAGGVSFAYDADWLAWECDKISICHIAVIHL